jgi:outer membrane protein
MRVLFPMTALLSAGVMLAQQAPMFPTPAYFRHQFSMPKAHVELQAPVRLKDFVVNGKLTLSLHDYLDLVMANNTDIAISRLNVETPRNNVWGAFGKFDPTLQFNLSAQRQLTQSTRTLDGATQVNSLTHNGGLTYSQMLSTGTTFTASLSDRRSSTNDRFATFNPYHSGSLQLSFTQPLLRNRSPFIVRMPTTLARSSLKKSEYDFRDSLLSQIQSAENAYWAVVGARENLKVAQSNLALKQEALKRANRELELGASSPLDIYQPQSDVATAEITVSTYQFALARAEDALRKMIGADLDPEVRKLPIELTEGILPPADEAPVDPEAAVQKAMNLRPDLKSYNQNLDLDNLNIQSAQNLLRPQLDLTGTYTSSGVGGNQLINGTMYPGGFNDFVSQVFGFNLPTYYMGFRLSFPIRDRANEAALANSMIKKRQDTLTLRTQQQSVRLSVLNAVNNLESAKAQVKLAQVSVDLAQKQVDAEQQKYDLGTEIMYFVLDAQNRLNSAKSNLVQQIIAYQNARTSLLRQTGELLDARGIVIK